MTFDDFKVLASKVENLELPGKKALFKMAPMERVKELKDVDIKALNPREAAVTALFYPNKDNQTFFLQFFDLKQFHNHYNEKKLLLVHLYEYGF